MKIGVEMNGLFVTMLLFAGMAIVLLSGIAEKITKVTYFVWGMSLLGVTLSFVAGMAARLTSRQLAGQSTAGSLLGFFHGWEGNSMMLGMVLAYLGILAVRYGVRYKKQILGMYALESVLLLVIVAAIGKPLLYEEPIIGVGSRSILASLAQLGFALGIGAMTILSSLAVVAKKRPIKIKRWIRLSLLFDGSGLLFVAMNWCISGKVIGTQGEITGILSFSVAWLFLCAMLHGKNTYEEEPCTMPLSFVMIGIVSLGEVWMGTFLFALLLARMILRIKKWLETGQPLEEWEPLVMIRHVTYLYSYGMFAIILLQQMITSTVWKVAGIVGTLLYGVAAVGILIWSQEALTKLQYVAVILWNSVFTLLIELGVAGGDVFSLVLVWISLFPITFFLLQIRKLPKKPYLVVQLFWALILLGAVTSFGFSKEQQAICTVSQSIITVKGEALDGERLRNEQPVMVHKVAGEYEVSTKQIQGVPKGEVLVTVRTRPLCTLICIGGVGLIGCIIWKMLLRV